LAVGRVGSWQLAVGSWQLAVGSWQLAVGSWQLAVNFKKLKPQCNDFLLLTNNCLLQTDD